MMCDMRLSAIHRTRSDQQRAVQARLGFPKNLPKYDNMILNGIGFTEGSKWCTIRS
jgi:hypothetical protein